MTISNGTPVTTPPVITPPVTPPSRYHTPWLPLPLVITPPFTLLELTGTATYYIYSST